MFDSSWNIYDRFQGDKLKNAFVSFYFNIGYMCFLSRQKWATYQF